METRLTMGRPFSEDQSLTRFQNSTVGRQKCPLITHRPQAPDTLTVRTVSTCLWALGEPHWAWSRVGTQSVWEPLGTYRTCENRHSVFTG